MRGRLLLFVVFCLVLASIVGLVLALGAGDLIYSAVATARLEAQARRDQAQAQLLAQRNERLVLRPLATAARVDTGMSVVYAVADRVLLLAVIAYLIWERRKYGTPAR